MIRTLWKNRHRANVWKGLRRLESVMILHMTELAGQRKVNAAQATLNAATTAVINQMHERVTALESGTAKDRIVHIFPGPFSERGKEHC